MELVTKNLAETQTLATNLAECCSSLNEVFIIYLIGDLGTGKTTLAQSFIRFFGFNRVKSPTYSLVESYQNESANIHHFDCYRLSDPEELDHIGIRDYLSPGSIQLIEWPELGKGIIAKADISISLKGDHDERQINIQTHTNIGKKVVQCAIS